MLTAALLGWPIGILASVAFAMAVGLRLPAHLRWRELIVVSLAASAGFTFALFFATSIMPPGPLLAELKLGALSTMRGSDHARPTWARSVVTAPRKFERLVSSNLLDAEVRAALARDRVAALPDKFAGVDWILPDRSLTPEIGRVLAAGALRGADLWHIACALYLDPAAGEVAFLTIGHSILSHKYGTMAPCERPSTSPTGYTVS